MRRRRIRSAARGAAMVEALIVILVLVLLDISLLYLHGAYAAKLTTMRGARGNVWTSGLNACEGGGSGVSSGGGDGSLGSVSGQVTSAKSIAKGTTLTKPLEMDLKTTAATASDQAKGHQTQFGGYQSLSLSTKSQLICNEKQQDVSTGDIRQTINALYGSML